MAETDDPRGEQISAAERAERRAALLTHIDRIAERTHWMKRGKDGQLAPDYSKLAEAAGLSRSGLGGILEGAEPRPRTLVLLARYGAISPLLLFRAAGWLSEEEVAALLTVAPPDEESSLIDEVVAQGEVSEDDVLTALEVAQRVHRLLAARLRDRVQRQRATWSEPPPSQEQGSAR